LASFDIVGVAGTTLLYCAAWHYAGPPHIFGQVANPDPTGKITVNIFGAPFPVIRDIQAIDGLFMAARRSVFATLSFDSATFDGFHHYDVDFSYGAFRAGRRLAVVNDICVLHASVGNYNQVWHHYAMKFQQKWFAGRPLQKARPFFWAYAGVSNLTEALQIMTPPYWGQHGQE
jgi:GT2 family glycosyltransferase